MQAKAHISKAAISYNYQYFKKQVAGAAIIPVVKANAYGHGAVEVARLLFETAGVKRFAVATLEEARELAQVLPAIEILIFSRIFAQELERLPSQAVLTVTSAEHARNLAQAAKYPLMAHLNINTGMNRLGLSPAEGLELIAHPPDKLNITGVYSHFSSADTAAEEVWQKQRTLFKKFIKQARQVGFQGLVHLANSAGALHSTEDVYAAIRLGIGLYGFDTTPAGRHQQFLQPAMEVSAPLIRVACLAAGASVSYGERWQASVATNIGTLRIGYADGYNRHLTNRGMVTFMGKQYPVVGTVTMDHIMLDLGADTPPLGSRFTVLGGTDERCSIQTVAQLLDTIPYEVCCAVSPRVQRVYSSSL